MLAILCVWRTSSPPLSTSASNLSKPSWQETERECGIAHLAPLNYLPDRPPIRDIMLHWTAQTSHQSAYCLRRRLDPEYFFLRHISVALISIRTEMMRSVQSQRRKGHYFQEFEAPFFDECWTRWGDRSLHSGDHAKETTKWGYASSRIRPWREIDRLATTKDGGRLRSISTHFAGLHWRKTTKSWAIWSVQCE